MDIPYEKAPGKVEMAPKLNEIKKQAQGVSAPTSPETTLNFGSVYLYDPIGFLNRFADIDNKSDAEVYEIVDTNYAYLLDMANDYNSGRQLTMTEMECAAAIGRILTNCKILLQLNNVIRSKGIDCNRTIYLNKLFITYLNSNNRNPLTESLMLEIGGVINAAIMNPLLGRGLSDKYVALMCIARNSSYDDILNVKMVNYTMFKTEDTSAFTLQSIVDVYQFLFNTSVTRLFEGTVFDVYAKEFLTSSSLQQQEIYGLQSMAVLEILNSMPMQSIGAVLYAFITDSHLQNGLRRPVRFDVSCLSADYARILEVVSQMAIQGVYA